MTDFQEKGTLYLWDYRFEGTQDDENDANSWAYSHELSREGNRLFWEMDCLVRNGKVEDVRACADRVRENDIEKLLAAREWVRNRSIPNGI